MFVKASGNIGMSFRRNVQGSLVKRHARFSSTGRRFSQQYKFGLTLDVKEQNVALRAAPSLLQFATPERLLFSPHAGLRATRVPIRPGDNIKTTAQLCQQAKNTQIGMALTNNKPCAELYEKPIKSFQPLANVLAE